jgi:hypothetical protein
LQKLVSGLVMALSIASIAAVATVAAAYEVTPIEAKLAKAPEAGWAKKLIDGRPWTCKGDVCTANAEIGRFQPLKVECANAAKVLGEFVSYRNGKDTLDAAALAACNTSKG